MMTNAVKPGPNVDPVAARDASAATPTGQDNAQDLQTAPYMERTSMNKQMLKELAEMGVIVVPLNDPKLLHEVLAELLDEEYQDDRRTHGQNKEWTR